MPAEERFPLSPEDRAILDLENDVIAGHTCKVVRVSGQLSAAELREAMAERMADAPELSRRLEAGGDVPEWVPDPDVDLGRHVTDASDPPAGGTEQAVAELFARRLERDRPLWKLDVLAGDGETTLVWRIHHALADGMTTMRIAEAVLFDPAEEEGAGKRGAHPAPAATPSSGGHRGFLLREFGRSVRRGPFDAAPGSERTVAFATVGLQPLHDAAKRLACATLNDAVLVSVAGGVRRWLDSHHKGEGTLRIKVPVSLHSAGDEAGNRDSFFIVGVPLEESEPAAALAAVHRETALRKERHDAQEMDAVLRRLAGLSAGLGRIAQRIEKTGRAFALNVSNVPGPSRDLAVRGIPVSSFHSLAEIAPHHSLRVAVVSVAGNLNFGIVADPHVVDDLPAIAGGITEEAARIIAA